MGKYEISGFFGPSTIYPRVPLHPNAKVGHVNPLPKEGVPILVGIKDGRPQLGIQHEVQVDGSILPRVRFGSGCDAIKGLPVILTLQRMADEVSRVVKSFAGEFGCFP